MTVPPQFGQYARLFNDGQFFAAHEVLEDLWWERDCDPFWQAFIILAAAHEKARRSEPSGAAKHFMGTIRYLEAFVPGRDGIDVRPVVAHARRCLAWIESGGDLHALPRFRMPPPELPGECHADAPAGEASDEEIRAVAAAVLAAGWTLPSVTKEVMLRLKGRAGRSRVEPVVRSLLPRG